MGALTYGGDFVETSTEDQLAELREQYDLLANNTCDALSIKKLEMMGDAWKDTDAYIAIAYRNLAQTVETGEYNLDCLQDLIDLLSEKVCSPADYCYDLLESCFDHQRAFKTVDPRYEMHGMRLVRKGYIILHPRSHSSGRLFEALWEPTQSGYDLFKRWKRLRDVRS